ncbi:MAG: hypothetical protein L0206_08720 [Actinobacteria bacterium]|nr:hypothetical protein [Actinomycetota bacterium]
MTPARPTSAFYVAADSRHFLGLVALINSVRLVGHDEPIYVADCGFVAAHRERLAEHVTFVATTGTQAPHLAKIVAPLARPADVMVLVDADVIVTRPLTGLIDEARSGKVVVFADRVSHRYDERWSQLLGLGPLRRQPYVNSGLVVAEGELGTTLLGQVAVGYEQVDLASTTLGHGSPDYPFFYVDQDVLNAYLATYPEESMTLLEHRLTPFPPFAGLRVVDETRLRCAYDDGVEPFALHHIARKPWMAATRWTIYSRFLARLLLGDDVLLPLRRDEVPLRLRPGTVGWLEKRRSDAVAAFSPMRGRVGLRRWLAGHTNRS